MLSNTPTFPLPQFPTPFLPQILQHTNPTTFSQLLQISPLSHPTHLSLPNPQHLIPSPISHLS
ncbi:hypothetical protein, partial [Staphylococcus hominis]|uniref:hypothetical protein n=1 Tax=Staphylococcus hominis TaxID=1290 RepID=UPI0037097D14